MALQKCGLNPDQRARELKPHGTAAFPCAAYEDWYGEEGRPEVPWHWHEELEAACVAEGAFCLQIPGERYVLETGDCVVINSGVPHSGIPQPKCRLQSLVFHPDLVGGNREQVFYKKYLSPLMETAAFKACVLRRDGCREETERFDRAFKAMAGEPEGFEFALREELSGLCLDLYRRYGRKMSRKSGGSGERDGLRLQKMLDYIHRNFQEEIGLADIARAADVGERECLRCFQRTVQLSPKQYLLKYRVAEGARLLAEEPWRTISETAAFCGFDSASHFSMTFRRFYNCTPREYRKSAVPAAAGAEKEAVE